MEEPIPQDDGGDALVLLSGGLDSTVLLQALRRERGHGKLHVLSFDYGQRHRRELECATWQAKEAGAATHRTIDLRFLGPLLQAGSALIAGGAEVPELAALDDDALRQPPTYVPNRNMMLLSLAAACAEAQGATTVFYGAQAQDEYGYWDCTEAFLERMNGVLSLNRRTPVRIAAPFVHTSKADIVAKGHGLGVDFAHTWSCYRGGERPCGVCPTCVERQKAFRANGMADPLEA